jgi:hypothetical protein
MADDRELIDRFHSIKAKGARALNAYAWMDGIGIHFKASTARRWLPFHATLISFSSPTPPRPGFFVSSEISRLSL